MIFDHGFLIIVGAAKITRKFTAGRPPRGGLECQWVAIVFDHQLRME